jgi:lysophospholipase L1-like esterase
METTAAGNNVPFTPVAFQVSAKCRQLRSLLALWWVWIFVRSVLSMPVRPYFSFEHGLTQTGSMDIFTLMVSLRRLYVLVLMLFGIHFCNATINIGCVGDSITAGVGVSNPSVDSYPARLQRLLGASTNYLVYNYGLSGATLLKQGDTPYWGTTTFFVSHGRFPTWAPQIVIIMLGSNDSKPQNWVYGTNFVSNYEDLIATYVTNAYFPDPRILICTPPPAFHNNININPGILETNISPLVRQLGTDQNIQVIDMQTLLAGHSEWFPDGVHPNSQGTAVMAAIVYTALLGDTMNGSTPALGIGLTNKNAVLNWPAGGAGWVLQSTPALGSTNVWPVTVNAAVNNGISVLLTNSIAGQGTMFRLWDPSIQNNQ